MTGKTPATAEHTISSDIDSGITHINKIRIRAHGSEVVKRAHVDSVAVEEPLQIILLWQDESANTQEKEFTITMRTPGQDAQLAIGLLNSEGIIRGYQDVLSVTHVTNDKGIEANKVQVVLAYGVIPDWQQYQRHLTMQSSCGICGKTSLQSLELKQTPTLDNDTHWLAIDTVLQLSDTMRDQQHAFLQTGGVHAVGLFDAKGQLQLIKEDVGRHNAMDKLIGANMALPQAQQSSKRVVVLSGRISFELVQKALMAGFPVIVAVGAPSSLAISVAQRFDITLIGFVSQKGFNVYHGSWRLKHIE
ncbi:formate dehydrogenase accessory sulfurtransferase FdhD [Thalassotalea maritima]|uniref:formate dehydrogenase accessory sulfurtransferase FdhD n=1 Tax=Thalassotalea maritima TaxID=3242416 RepID=UPI0035283BB5